MLKQKVDPARFVDLLARIEEDGERVLTVDQYQFWCEQVKDQIMFRLGDKGDDGYVIEHGLNNYQAFWFVGVHGDSKFIHVHTAERCDTPFEALELITEIIKTDWEDVNQEACNRLFGLADEVA